MPTATKTRHPVVYQYADPRTGAVRYVGSTALPVARRLISAMSAARTPGPQSTTPVNRWLYQLNYLGIKPVVTVLERLNSNASTKALRAAEAFWTSTLRNSGADLLNARLSDGIHFESSRQAMRKPHRPPIHRAIVDDLGVVFPSILAAVAANGGTARNVSEMLRLGAASRYKRVAGRSYRYWSEVKPVNINGLLDIVAVAQ